MRDLWRKTVQAVRDCPALLWVLACVSLLNFYLHRLNEIIPRWVFRWVATRQSVLGFETHIADSAYELQKRALLLAAPMSLSLNIAIASAYVAGFVLTARLVRDKVEGQRPNWPAAFAFLRSRIMRVVLFAIAIFVLIDVGAILAAGILNLRASAFLRTNLGFEYELLISSMVGSACIAWIILPLSLRLIVDSSSQTFTRKSKITGRIAAITAVLINLALNELTRNFAPEIIGAFQPATWLRSDVIWPGISILGDLPLFFLWVFLALLVYQVLEMPEIPSPS